MTKKTMKTKQIAKDSKEKNEETLRKKPVELPKLKPSELKAKIMAKLAIKSKSESIEDDGRNHKQEMVPAEAMLEGADNLLECCICLETFLLPTNTQCGHTYCLPCAEQVVGSRKQCAVCKSPASLSGLIPQSSLKKLVECQINSKGQEIKSSYLERMAAFQADDATKKVSPDLKVGDLVDFWSQEGWSVGRVLFILAQDREKKKVVVSYMPNGDLTYEQISLPSRLIAKHRAYTASRH